MRDDIVLATKVINQ